MSEGNVTMTPKPDSEWKVKYQSFIQFIPCTLSMKIAWALQVFGIVQWLLLSESRVLTIRNQTDKSLLLAPYLEGILAAVLFPLLYLHLKRTVDTIKTVKATTNYLFQGV